MEMNKRYNVKLKEEKNIIKYDPHIRTEPELLLYG